MVLLLFQRALERSPNRRDEVLSELLQGSSQIYVSSAVGWFENDQKWIG